MTAEHFISTGVSASNDQFSDKFWIFVLIFFQPTLKSGLKEVQFTQNCPFWVKAPLNTLELEGVPNFKTWPRVKNITLTKIQNLTLNFLYDALLKWHDPDIGQGQVLLSNFIQTPQSLCLFLFWKIEIEFVMFGHHYIRVLWQFSPNEYIHSLKVKVIVYLDNKSM